MQYLLLVEFKNDEGLTSVSREASLDRLSNYSDEALLNELRRIAKVLGRSTLSISDIEAHARCSYELLKMRFGGLHAALRAAGLMDLPFHRHVSDEDLISNLVKLWDTVLLREGRRPYRDDLRKYGSNFSQGPYIRRWGSWLRACEAALEHSAALINETWEPSESAPISNGGLKLKSVRKRPIPLKLRYEIMKRDKFSCLLCGRAPVNHSGLKLHVDHISPEWAGGPALADNLRTLCEECNLGRGAARNEL